MTHYACELMLEKWVKPEKINVNTGSHINLPSFLRHLSPKDFVEILGQHINFLQKMTDLETNWDEKQLEGLAAIIRPFFKFIDQLMSSAFGFRVGSEKEKLFFSICWEQFYGKALFVKKSNVVYSFKTDFYHISRMPLTGVMLETKCN